MQRDAAELSGAACSVPPLLKSPPSLPRPPFPSLKKVVFKNHITWGLLANSPGMGRLWELFGRLRHPKNTPAPTASRPGWVPHASAGSRDKTGRSVPNRIVVQPDKAMHTMPGLGAAFRGQGHLPSAAKFKGKLRPARDAASGLLIRWEDPKPDRGPCGAQDTSLQQGAADKGAANPALGDSGDVGPGQPGWRCAGTEMFPFWGPSACARQIWLRYEGGYNL